MGKTNNPGGKFKPTALKMLHADGKRAERLRKREIPTTGGLADAPEWMTAEQKAGWAYALENAPRDVLKRIDRAVLAGFIVAEDAHREAAIAIQKMGLLIKGSRNKTAMVQNPQVAIMNRQFELMLRAATELGFTPVSRARLESTRPLAAPADDWAEVAVA